MISFHGMVSGFQCPERNGRWHYNSIFKLLSEHCEKDGNFFAWEGRVLFYVDMMIRILNLVEFIKGPFPGSLFVEVLAEGNVCLDYV